MLGGVGIRIADDSVRNINLSVLPASSGARLPIRNQLIGLRGSKTALTKYARLPRYLFLSDRLQCHGQPRRQVVLWMAADKPDTATNYNNIKFHHFAFHCSLTSQLIQLVLAENVFSTSTIFSLDLTSR